MKMVLVLALTALAFARTSTTTLVADVAARQSFALKVLLVIQRRRMPSIVAFGNAIGCDSCRGLRLLVSGVAFARQPI